MKGGISFAKLSAIDPAKIAIHTSNPKLADHMPLLHSARDSAVAAKFFALKEAGWAKDSLRHWAFLLENRCVGWRGFQKDGDEWEIGLILKPCAFGPEPRSARKVANFAIADKRFPFITFLLPPSSQKFGAL